MDIEPVHYHFDAGKTYLVFAKATNTPGVYAALWNMPQSEGNQGVFLCADDKAASSTLKDEVWAELTGLLEHHDNTDILYAIRKLDQMSGMGWGAGPPTRFESTLDFDRKPVIDAVHGFVASSDPKVAEAAIMMIGSNNPYLTQERAWFWLATVGSGEISGLSKMNPKMENIGGELYWSDLVAVANSPAPETTRALAIRALGLARKPEIGAQLDKWLTDTSAPVRSAATVVLADYPELSNAQRLNRTYVDPNADVRIATAQCIGFGQVKDGVKFLSSMLNDSNLEVRKAAAQSLLSFSPRDPDVAAILKANLGNHEFAEVFTISLARIDPEPYRDELARSVATWSPTNPPPAWWWGGRIPSGDAQEILFKYLKAQSAEKLKAGGLDRYLDVIEKASFNNLGSPLDVYAFYIRHGLTTRAQTLRQAALKAFPYQQAIQYDQAAEHPEIYDQ
jgi:HEAT repeat protein